MERIGEIQHFLGDKREAAEALRSSINVERQLADTGEAGDIAVSPLMARHRKLAQVQLALAQGNNAERTHATGLEYAESLDRDAAVEDDRLELALYQLLGAELAARAGRLKDAETMSLRALEDLKALVRQDRDRLDWQVAKFQAQLLLTDLMRRLGRLADAEKQGRETLDGIQYAMQNQFHDARELVQLAAEAHDQFAAVALDLGQPEVAVRHLREALLLKQQNPRAKRPPIVFVMEAFFGLDRKQRPNFGENYEVIPFCSYAETQLRLVHALAKVGRPYEAERHLGECMLTAYLLCTSQHGHDLRYMLLYGGAWSTAAEMLATDRPQDVGHLRRAADYVWQGVAACFPKAIDQPDLPREVRNRIAWHIDHGAARLTEAQRDLYKNLAASVIWKTGFVEQALGLSWRHNRAWESAIEHLERSVALRKSGQARDWLQIAIAHHQLGNHKDAEKWLKQALEALGDKPTADLVELRAEAEELIQGTQQQKQPQMNTDEHGSAEPQQKD